MKIKIDVNEDLEEEIIIKCKHLTPAIQKIQQAVMDVSSSLPKLSFYKEDVEYYLPLTTILFFETNDNKVIAHTIDNFYQMKYRLYELEEFLPHNFIRISKSTIVNTEKIFSITHTLTSPNVIQFSHSHKQVFVSRLYFKALKNRLEERSFS